MLDVLNLALPYFGLIFLGLLCGKLKQIPETGLAWMNFFIIYVSLPCLFYRVLAQTPLEKLNNPPFIVATTAATGAMFALAFAIGWGFRRRIAEATIAGLSGAYGNIGYMGPGLALATLGSAANVPVAVQRIPWEVPGTIAINLIVHPAVVLLVLSLLGPFDPVWVSTAVLMAALPPALNVFIMARQYDTWVAQASGAVLFGTFVSVLTLTSVMFLVKSGMLPATLLR
jgi:predicted permease